MLAHSPSLLLVIDYAYDITPGDEVGVILALKQRDRVRRICLWLPDMNLQNLIEAMDDEYHPGRSDHHASDQGGHNTSRNISGTTPTPPHADRLCPSDKVFTTVSFIAHDYCG
jgi:hypothetical protein